MVVPWGNEEVFFATEEANRSVRESLQVYFRRTLLPVCFLILLNVSKVKVLESLRFVDLAEMGDRSH